ncbi:MAG: hypothetical protein KGI90_02815 [Burkholderiales bacterium]|nr:hypothetical protein [Burkholderiales bacterium]
MKIAYIDPGLSRRSGHNAAMLAEFDEALVGERGHALTVFGSARLDPREFADLRAELRPACRLDGYARPAAADLADPARLDRLLQTVAEDLPPAQLAGFDAWLMPTVYPLHLLALARSAEHQRVPPALRSVLGMLLPCAFWADDAASQQRVGEAFAAGVQGLAATTQAFAYSETGHFHFGAQRVALATLLPPLATANAGRLAGLAAASAARDDRGPPTLGFFGTPFGSKGIQLLQQAAQALAAAGRTPACRLRIRLPQGYAGLCQHLQQIAPWIDAQSRGTSNAEYLAEMADVDAVWALYDPLHYGDKMSGIVPEALSLGKPVLVAEGCVAIQEFLERHAPGAFVAAGYDLASVLAVLALAPADWQPARRCARSHAPLVQQLKGMDRYLAVCGIH